MYRFILTVAVLFCVLLWILEIHRRMVTLDSHSSQLTFAWNSTRMCVHDSSSTMATGMKSEVTFYNLSENRLDHYEFRYALNTSSTRLILLLGGASRSCVDWWSISVGQRIISKMRSAGFSILAICSKRKNDLIQMPIQTNIDVNSIYLALQMWMNDIYVQRFQYYPLLYLFGVSQGSPIGSLLCRVLPIQAQIFYILPGYRPSRAIALFLFILK